LWSLRLLWIREALLIPSFLPSRKICLCVLEFVCRHQQSYHKGCRWMCRQ
jgi:hypothetical protein